MNSLQVSLSRKLTGLDSSFYVLILVCLVASLSYLAARLAHVLMLRPQMVWPLWPGCALLVAVLLLTPRKIWPALTAAAFSGFVLYDLQAGLTIRSIVLLILSDAVEVLIAAWGVSYAFGGMPHLDSIKSLTKYLFFAVILAPISAAFAGAAGLGGNYWITWRVSFLTEALAMLTLTPAILGWVSTVRTWGQKERAFYLETAVLIAGLVVLAYVTFVASAGSSRPVLLYSLIPFLLWAALRLGTMGIATSMIVVAFLSIWGVVHGDGPFTGQEPLSNVFSLQLFLLFATIPFMVLAALMEERKQAEHALKQSEARERTKAKELETVLEAVPIPVLIASDGKCVRISANRAGCEMLRLPRGANASKSAPVDEQPGFRIMRDGVEVPPEDLPIQRAAATAKPVFGVPELVIFEDGTERNVVANAAPLLGEDDMPYGAVAAVLDVTDRNRAEEALRKSEEKFHKAFRESPMVLTLARLEDDRYIDVNETFEQFFGYRREEALGRTSHDLGLWDNPGRFEQLRLQLLAEGGNLRNVECKFRNRAGQLIIGLLSSEMIEINGEQCTISTVLDITDRKLAEEALANIGGRLIEAHEEERAWIARELHDDINQRVALLVIELQRLQDVLPESTPTAHDHIRHLRQRLSDLGTDIQAMSHRLHSSKLEYLGIAAAARSFCKELSDQQKVEIDFSHSNIARSLSREISLCLFRVLQEALQNAVKHSGVRHFTVELRGVPGEIQLTVSDLGIGFDVKAALAGRGLGLISMQERLQLTHGELSIMSEPNSGTTIFARVPLRTETNRASVAG